MTKNQYYPDLSTEVELEIEEKQTGIHKKYWDQLRILDEEALPDSLLRKSIKLVPSPPPPVRQPKKLVHIVRSYARELFEVEATKYPNNRFLKLWLDELENRIYDAITDRISHLENIHYHASEETAHAAILDSLRHSGIQRLHGLTYMPSRDTSAVKRKRLTSTITSHKAVKKLEAYLAEKNMALDEFAKKAQTTGRSLRRFRKTGKIRRSIFDSIAAAMGRTRDELLRS